MGDPGRERRAPSHLALETTEPTSFGYGFVSGLLSALLGMAGFGIVLSLRFPQYFGYGELRPLQSVEYLRAGIHLLWNGSLHCAAISTSFVASGWWI